MSELNMPEQDNTEVGQQTEAGETPKENQNVQSPESLLAPKNQEDQQQGVPVPAPEGEQTHEAKDGKKAEGDGQEEKKKAPEKYEVKAPEGMAIDEKLVEEFEPLARKLDLSNDEFQELADFYADKINTNATKMMKLADEINTQWAEEAAKDSEFGGDKYMESIGVINSAFKAFDPEGTLRTTLAETKMLNNPEILRLLYRVGKQISEDSTPGGSGGASQKTAAEILYGKK